MKTSTIVVMGILGLAATPLALHLAGGSTTTTKNWIKTLHGGSAAGSARTVTLHGGSGVPKGSEGSGVPTGSGVPAVLEAAQDAKATPAAAADLTGKWSLTIESDQGNMTTALVLKQDGKKVTGTMTNPHGEDQLPITGEFAAGTLTMAVDAATDHDEMHIAFKGTAKKDGSLAGTLTSAMGDMAWTAVRAKEK